MTPGGWTGCLMSHHQLDPWLELGALGFAGPLSSPELPFARWVWAAERAVMQIVWPKWTVEYG